MAKIHAVNVLEIIDPDTCNVSIRSFTDDKEGNRQAEELMFKLAKENGYIGSAKNSDEFLDEEGETWSNSSNYSVIITHSTYNSRN